MKVTFFYNEIELNNNSFFSVKPSNRPNVDIDFTITQQNTLPLGDYPIKYTIEASSYSNIQASYLDYFNEVAWTITFTEQNFECEIFDGEIKPLPLTCDKPSD